MKWNWTQKKVLIRNELNSLFGSYRYVLTYLCFFLTSYLGLLELWSRQNQVDVLFNIWDFYFSTLFDPYFMTYFYIPLFFILILPFFKLPNRLFLIRIKSRMTWYYAKLLGLNFVALFFSITGITLTTIIGGFNFPFSQGWSEASFMAEFFRLPIPELLPTSGFSPIFYVIIGVILLYLGLFLLANIGYLVYIFTKSPLATGLFIFMIWGSIIWWMVDGHQIGHYSYFFFLNMHMYIVHSGIYSIFTPIISILVLSTLNIIISLISIKLLKRLEF